MSINCPDCGGTELRQLTPNAYECLGQRLSGFAPPEATGLPQPVPVYEPCGARFQAGQALPTPKCVGCGLDSIGACEGCGRRLCGRHGTSTGPFLCRKCLDRRNRANAEPEALVSREKERLDQERTERARAILLRSNDPCEVAATLRDHEDYVSADDCRDAWRRLVPSIAVEPTHDYVEFGGHGSIFRPWREESKGRVPLWRAEGVGRILNHADVPGDSGIDVFLAADGRHWRSDRAEEYRYFTTVSLTYDVVLPRGMPFRTKNSATRRGAKFVWEGWRLVRSGDHLGEESPHDLTRAVANVFGRAG